MKISIVLPVYNEEVILVANVLKLVNFCKNNLSDDWEIIIADNNSGDHTSILGKKLAAEHSAVKYLYVDKIGKGMAIRSGWQSVKADIYCFMDADLATDISALPDLIAGIKEGNDLVIGSRAHRQSKVSRQFIRRVVSFGYRLVLKIMLNLKINDTPCGFKAINQRVKDNILPLVQNNKWFFDSELVILAEKAGYKIKEIPIVWFEPRRAGAGKSKVNIFSVSYNYFTKVLELKKRLKQI